MLSIDFEFPVLRQLKATPRRLTNAATVAPVQKPGKGARRLNLGSQDPVTIYSTVAPEGTPKIRDGYLYVPSSYSAASASPVLVALHGAGATGRGMLTALGNRSILEEHQCLLLAPDSRGSSWDAISSDEITIGGSDEDKDPDLYFIDKALSKIFDQYHVDPERIAICGFSDGGSYAVSNGINNPGLFSHIMAFSAGFMLSDVKHQALENNRAAAAKGQKVSYPKVYVTHGVKDADIPVWNAQSICRDLREVGADVTCELHKGRHNVLRHKAAEALKWFLANGPEC